MPGFDRRGPIGQGTRTGRSMGKCNPDNETSGKNIAEDEFPEGRGIGKGRALGNRFRNRAYRNMQ